MDGGLEDGTLVGGVEIRDRVTGNLVLVRVHKPKDSYQTMAPVLGFGFFVAIREPRVASKITPHYNLRKNLLYMESHIKKELLLSKNGRESGS